MRKDKAESVQN